MGETRTFTIDYRLNNLERIFLWFVIDWDWGTTSGEEVRTKLTKNGMNCLDFLH